MMDQPYRIKTAKCLLGSTLLGVLTGYFCWLFISYELRDAILKWPIACESVKWASIQMGVLTIWVSYKDLVSQKYNMAMIDLFK